MYTRLHCSQAASFRLSLLIQPGASESVLGATVELALVLVEVLVVEVMASKQAASRPLGVGVLATARQDQEKEEAAGVDTVEVAADDVATNAASVVCPIATGNAERRRVASAGLILGASVDKHAGWEEEDGEEDEEEEEQEDDDDGDGVNAAAAHSSG